VQIRERVPLAPLTSLGVGGPAAQLVEASTVDELIEALAWAREHHLPAHVLGGGSNVVVSDAGVPALVVRVAIEGREVRERADAVEVTAGAGEPWDEFVASTISAGWAGLECLSGIPGRVGASPIQNVGAYGREIGELVTSVRVLDRTTLETRTLTAQECAFAYRDSAFKRGLRDRYVVLAVTYRLVPGGSPTLRYAELQRHFATQGTPDPTLAEVREGVLAIRRAKSMLEDPTDQNGRSCGSFFVNPIVSRAELAAIEARADTEVPRYAAGDDGAKIPAAWLIEHAGFAKGLTDGPVGLSTRHTLAIVAHDGARAADVIRFAWRVRRGVEDRFGVRLVPEPEMWGFERFEARLPIVD
jgi:UDP-N-acetylmuramate dehydrogenase